MHTRTTDTPTAPEARRRTLPAPAIARSEPVPLPGDKPPGALPKRAPAVPYPQGHARPNPPLSPGGSQTGDSRKPARNAVPASGPSRRPAAPGRLRRFLVALLAAIMLVPTGQVPADAYSVQQASTPSYVGPPGLYYMNERNLGGFDCDNPDLLAQHCSTLDMYYNAMHWGGTVATRYRIRVRAGSGLNDTNECTTDHGPAPSGLYRRNRYDNSELTFYYKTESENIVYGWVWYMGSKRCNGGTGIERTGLFIHSQGWSGWEENNYRSAGCIKINQVDRAFMANAYRTAYSNTRGILSVE